MFLKRGSISNPNILTSKPIAEVVTSATGEFDFGSLEFDDYVVQWQVPDSSYYDEPEYRA